MPEQLTSKQSAHTPGPWRVERDGPSGGLYVGTRDAWLARMLFGMKTSHSEAVANAHVMAAGPEMLAALKHLMRYDFGDSDGAKEARAAIDKAEGRL